MSYRQIHVWVSLITAEVLLALTPLVVPESTNKNKEILREISVANEGEKLSNLFYLASGR